jgi:hypothetical protein
MTRLPQVGGDAGSWGEVLNDFLSKSHRSDGTLKDNSIDSSNISPLAVTKEKIALGSIEHSHLSLEVQQDLNAGLGPGSVGTEALVEHAVTPSKIALLGDPNGVASLDGLGRVPEAQIPERLSPANLAAASSGGITRTSRDSSERFSISAGDLTPQNGTPTLANTPGGFKVPAWLFDANTPEATNTIRFFPDWVQMVDVDVVWTSTIGKTWLVSPTNTVTIMVNGASTTALPVSSNAATVKAAVEALSTVGANMASVVDNSGSAPWRITLDPSLINVSMSLASGAGAVLASSVRWRLIMDAFSDAQSLNVAYIEYGVTAEAPVKDIVCMTRIASSVPVSEMANIIIGRVANSGVDSLPADTALMGLRLTVSQSANPAQAPPRNLNIPAGTVIRGANIGPTISQSASGHREMWSTNWSWSLMQSQIDDAISIGATAVRIIGSITAVTLGYTTLDTYLQRWKQVLDYCASKGIWVFACGGSLAYWGTTTLAQAQAHLVAWAMALDAHDALLAIDVTNECFAAGAVAGLTSDEIIQQVTQLNAAVRQVTTKPITNSRTAHSLGRWDGPEGAWLDNMNDFHSVHSYYAMSEIDPRPWLNKWWGRKPVILGEFGAALDLSSSARADRYKAAKKLIESNPQFVGAFAWAVRDIAVGDANAWGMFDESRAPRADVVDVFKTLPTSR